MQKRFYTNPTRENLISHYGLARVVEAQEDCLNGVHNSLCWFFIGDYCRDMKCSPYDSDNYNRAKEMFFKLLREV